jgi:hypothetical protein
MNAKLCKQTRVQARELTVGQPLHQLVAAKQQCTPTYNPKTRQTMQHTATCAVNNPDSTRGLYRDMKRVVRGKRMLLRHTIVMEKARAPRVVETTTGAYTRTTTPQAGKGKWYHKLASFIRGRG